MTGGRSLVRPALHGPVDRAASVLHGALRERVLGRVSRGAPVAGTSRRFERRSVGRSGGRSFGRSAASARRVVAVRAARGSGSASTLIRASSSPAVMLIKGDPLKQLHDDKPSRAPLNTPICPACSRLCPYEAYTTKSSRSYSAPYHGRIPAAVQRSLGMAERRSSALSKAE